MRELPNLSASIFGILVSSTYIWQARAIEDSLLSDEVGAGGVPAGVGLVMMAASLALLVKTMVARARASAPQGDAAQSDAPQAGDGAAHPHRMALGLLAILAGYVALLPLAGYIVSIGLLVAAVGLFAGARRGLPLVLFALATGPLLWFLFQYLLQVRLPAGAWPALFGG